MRHLRGGLATLAGRNRSRWSAAVVAAGLVGSAGAAFVAPAPTASATIEHPSLVPTTPATGYPIIRTTPTYLTVNGNCPNGCALPREVTAVDQIGRYIVSGGNFYEVELTDGTVLQQKYFAAWNVDTKQMVCANKFTFDDEVLAVAPGPTATKVYVGGRFSKVTGANGSVKTRTRIALIDLANCSVDGTFISLGANDKITNIVRNGERLYIGGDFTAIGGQPIETIAELNATTGALNPGFSFPTSGEQLGRIKALALNPDATRLIVAGRFGTMTRGGASVVNPTAVIDISVPANPVLTAHSSTGYVAIDDLQAASVSPNGDTIGLAFGTATVSDYVYLTPTTESPNVGYRWRHFMRDSSFGVAVSNNAFYVTGHFCKPDPGPGTSDVMTPQMGLDTCTGTSYSGGSWRSHIAALSLTDGTPLAWNPGQNSINGGKALTLTNRGLLSGFDGDRVNGVRTGAVAFLDFGPSIEDVTPPSDVSFLAPTPDGTVNQPALISGSAADNLAVNSYRVGIRSAAGTWLQPDGTFAATYYEFYIKAAVDSTFTTQFALPAGTYTAVARAVDGAGLRSLNDATVKFTESGDEGVLPASTLITPPAPIGTDTPLTISGAASDNTAVSSVKVEVLDAAGSYVQDDGTIAAVVNDLPVTITSGALATPAANWTTSAGATLPAGDYTIRVTVLDQFNNVLTLNRIVTVVPTSPVVTWTTPATRIVNDEALAVNATVTDNMRVQSAKLRVSNAAGLFLQANGSFASSSKDLPATFSGLGTANATVTYAGGILAAGTYKATVIATDNIGNTTTANRTVTVAATQQIVTKALTGYTGFRSNKSNYMTGYTFQVSQARTVTALGLFDLNGNGINDNPDAVSAGLWRQSDRALLGRASIRKNAVVDAGWFYANLAAPVTLQPGVVYVVAVQSLRIGEGFADLGTAPRDPGVTIRGFAYSSGINFVYPATQGTGVLGYGLPNMRFVEERSMNPVVNATAPAASVTFGQPLAVSATATDNSQITSLRLTVTNSISEIMQDDGTFATGVANDMPVTLGGINTASATLGADLGMLPVGSYTLNVIAADLGGNVTTLPRTLTVAPTATKQPPTVLALANRSDLTGVPVSFPVRAADPDGGAVSYAATGLPAGITLDAATGRISGAATAAGSSMVVVTVRDDESVTTSVSFTWTTAIPKVAPIVTAPANRSDRIGDSISLQIVASDPDGGAVTFAAAPLPDGLTLDAATGLVTGSPTTVGTSTVTVTVTDDEAATVQASFTWTVSPALAPPVVTAIGDRTDQTGSAVNLQIVASDPDGGAVTFAADQLPAGLTLDAATGRITGTPTTVAATVVTITVTDDEAVTAQTSFTWTLVTPPPPCVVTAQAQGVLVDWLPIAGVTSYTVRMNGAFLATVTGADSYAHTAGVMANTYVIRYRSGAANVDIACTNG